MIFVTTHGSSVAQAGHTKQPARLLYIQGFFGLTGDLREPV